LGDNGSRTPVARQNFEENEGFLPNINLSKESFIQCFMESACPVFISDSWGRVLFSNRSFEKFVRCEPESILGVGIDRFRRVDPSGDGRCPFTERAVGIAGSNRASYRDTAGEQHAAQETWTRLRADNGSVYVVCTVQPLGDGDILGVFPAAGGTDPLTRLPTRTLFLDRVDQALRQAPRQQKVAAVLFLDLDRFKDTNDTYGHPVGDKVLCEAADRLRSCLRDSDTVARLGGDEFAMVLPDAEAIHDVARVADRILDAFRVPIELADGRQIYLGCSIGIACWPSDGTDAEALIHNADMALYAAKNGGRNRRVFFDEGMKQAVEMRIQLEHDLRRAVAERAFDIVYQPVFETGMGVVAVEALVRLPGADGTTVEPGRFIPVAEDIGLGPAIGAIVLQKSCRQAAAWRQEGAERLTLSVNVSRRQVEAEGFVDAVRAALDESGLPESALIIEVHESVIMADTPAVEAALRRVAKLGVTIAVDDFGSGYSSLKRLMDLPLATLKISRGFINDLVEGRNGPALVGLVTHIADQLGLTVIAEGVETEDQASQLADIACTRQQGFLHGRPVPAEEISRALFGAAKGNLTENVHPEPPESTGIGLKLARMLGRKPVGRNGRTPL